MEAQVQRHESTKTIGGRVSQEWLLRAFLAAPHASARALAHSFKVAAGTDACTNSRPTMTKIRDAWTEMYKAMVYTSTRKAVETHFACAPLKTMFIVHVQDEADIRLRSGDARDGPSLPRRGRSSKVQAHVVTVVAGSSRRDIPTELEALGDKTAATLATSMETLLRGIVGSVLPERSAHGHGAREEQAERWIVHIVVGDGVPTNLKAAKHLWASITAAPFGSRVRYFLLVVKCGTHQAALSAKSGVTGSFAAAVGGELYKTVAGTAVRLFKYIINDYYEEFCHSVRDWVSKKLHVLAHSDGHRSPPAGLRDLYSSHVISDEMMFLWNGIKPMHEDKCLLHEVGVGVDPTTERHALVARFTLFIVQLLRVDSHPTVTRFFTFRANLDRMLAMHFIGMVPKCFRVLSTKPREETKKRIALVQGFLAHPEAPQVLRRSSLILQLTGGVEALTATTPRAGEDPVLVSLVKGAVDDVVTTRLQRLFGATILFWIGGRRQACFLRRLQTLSCASVAFVHTRSNSQGCAACGSRFLVSLRFPISARRGT